uniref:F-box domain-containing protein n=1 Tax=Panagrellus redivivus TaxID=6233 RepID=A0A7E4WBX6_PANRE
MPYPILTLPYPFAQRLRQLLNPFELKQLQLAAGHNVINPLKPIVPSSKERELYFIKNFNTDPDAIPTYDLYLGSHPTGLSQPMISIPKNDKYLIKCLILRFYDMSHLALTSLNTDTLSIKPFRIDLDRCQIRQAFLKTLSKLVIKPSQLCMWSSPDVDEGTTFSTILNIFPSVNSIAFAKSYFGWLSDLASTRRRFLAVDILHHDVEKIFSFRPEELYSFVIEQHPQFRFHILVVTDDVDATVKKIAPFIDPRFTCEKNGYLKFMLTVKNIMSRYQQEYYLKKI